MNRNKTDTLQSSFSLFSFRLERAAAHLGSLGDGTVMFGTVNGSLLSMVEDHEVEIRLSGFGENLDHDLESCRIVQLRFAGMTLPSAADKSTEFDITPIGPASKRLPQTRPAEGCF